MPLYEHANTVSKDTGLFSIRDRPAMEALVEHGGHHEVVGVFSPEWRAGWGDLQKSWEGPGQLDCLLDQTHDSPEICRTALPRLLVRSNMYMVWDVASSAR
jgi:hypothetical protein